MGFFYFLAMVLITPYTYILSRAIFFQMSSKEIIYFLFFVYTFCSKLIVLLFKHLLEISKFLLKKYNLFKIKKKYSTCTYPIHIFPQIHIYSRVYISVPWADPGIFERVKALIFFKRAGGIGFA